MALFHPHGKQDPCIEMRRNGGLVTGNKISLSDKKSGQLRQNIGHGCLSLNPLRSSMMLAFRKLGV